MNMPLNMDWQQILLHLLNFVILFAILYFLLYEPVKKSWISAPSIIRNLMMRRRQNLKAPKKPKHNI